MSAKIKSVGKRSAVEHAAAEMRAAILKANEGDFLGNEAALAQRLGVSAPTFRQAARLLEHEQLVVVKRGVNGGYFAGRPGLDSAVHVAAMALRAQPGGRDQAYEVAWPNFLEAVRLAARSKNKALRAELAEFAAVESSAPADVRGEAALLDVIVRMSENAALILILRILYNDFGLAVALDPRKVPASVVGLRSALAAAVLAGDADGAIKIAEARRLIIRPPETGAANAAREGRKQKRHVWA